VAQAGSERARASSTRTLLSIGQVLQRLTPEFPDLSPSKLRFLEDRELIHPGRTPAGYRTYSSDDVERLRFILGLQRDHYLPLKVIKQYVDDVDAGRDVEAPIAKPVGPVVGRTGRLDRRELLERTGAEAALLDEAIAQGLIPAGRLFDQHDERILRALHRTSECGLTPRHLRGLRTAAEREVDLVRRAVASLTGPAHPSSKRSATERAQELADDVHAVRMSLVRRALDQLES
jgi:DNA-binding transcriptional MerR regulator